MSNIIANEIILKKLRRNDDKIKYVVYNGSCINRGVDPPCHTFLKKGRGYGHDVRTGVYLCPARTGCARA